MNHTTLITVVGHEFVIRRVSDFSRRYLHIALNDTILVDEY
jgi:hypothetical protein